MEQQFRIYLKHFSDFTVICLLCDVQGKGHFPTLNLDKQPSKHWALHLFQIELQSHVKIFLNDRVTLSIHY